MADLVMVVVIGVFFALAVAYVRLCDRVIGPDPTDPNGSMGDEHEEVRGDLRVGR